MSVSGSRGGLIKDDFGKDYLLTVGEVYGHRVWGIQDGKLTASFNKSITWEPGINEAVCYVDAYRTGWQPYYCNPEIVGPWGTIGWSFFKWNLEKKPKPHKYDAPLENCTCGFYAYSDPKLNMSGTVKGIVRITGRVLIGTKGYRFQKGEVVAALNPLTQKRGPWEQYNPDAPWRKNAHDALTTNYSHVPLFDNEDEMFKAFPLTEPEK